MDFLSGKSSESLLLLHGGAGPMDPSKSGIAAATEALRRIASEALQSRDDLMELAVRSLEGMEDDGQFNAGFGSALQADGQARLSASLMNGSALKFSGVISVSDIKHPSRLALALQNKSSRVLTIPGALRLARELNMPPADLVSEKRLNRWIKARTEHQKDEFDTVGVVVWNDDLVAGTSTGGRGFENPGRVSDSATVAGNYASEYAAISLTGIGEQIVDAGVAVRIETRVRDGMTLEAACRKTFDEATALGHEYGWIAADKKGNWCVAYTTENMTFLVQTFSGDVLASS